MRVVNGTPERERCHNADTRNRHQSTRCLITVGKLSNMPVKFFLLSADLLVNHEKRPNNGR